jgi:hypothetical protein
MSEPCQCEAPGHCPIFNRPIVGRLWQICRGINATPPLTEAYRLLWLEPVQSGEQVEAGSSLSSDRSRPCKHRGQPTGEAIACPTCVGHVEVKILHCAIHERCTVGKPVGIACCATCGDYDGESAADDA